MTPLEDLAEMYAAATADEWERIVAPTPDQIAIEMGYEPERVWPARQPTQQELMKQRWLGSLDPWQDDPPGSEEEARAQYRHNGGWRHGPYRSAAAT